MLYQSLNSNNYTNGLQLVLSGGRTSFIKKINLKY